MKFLYVCISFAAPLLPPPSCPDSETCETPVHPQLCSVILFIPARSSGVVCLSWSASHQVAPEPPRASARWSANFQVFLISSLFELPEAFEMSRSVLIAVSEADVPLAAHRCFSAPLFCSRKCKGTLLAKSRNSWASELLRFVPVYLTLLAILISINNPVFELGQLPCLTRCQFPVKESSEVHPHSFRHLILWAGLRWVFNFWFFSIRVLILSLLFSGSSVRYTWSNISSINILKEALRASFVILLGAFVEFSMQLILVRRKNFTVCWMVFVTVTSDLVVSGFPRTVIGDMLVSEPGDDAVRD